MKGTHLAGLMACQTQDFHLPYCPIQPKHPWEKKLCKLWFFASTWYTSSPLFLDNTIFSLDILHGREAGGLHGPQVDLAELGQHAVEPAVDGLEQCCHKLFDYLNSKLPMVLFLPCDTWIYFINNKIYKSNMKINKWYFWYSYLVIFHKLNIFSIQYLMHIQFPNIFSTRTTTSLSRCLLLMLTLYCPGWVYLNI